MVRVLLVDDEPFIVQGLKVMLEGQSVNCEVVGEASNGKEALEFLKQREVDLVFADIKMPVMTGLELLETIRTEKISDAYFVILSGYSDFQYAQQALRYDCMDYVLKPVKHEELERILEQVEKLNREKEEQEEKEQHWEQAVFLRNILAVLSGETDSGVLQYLRDSLPFSGAFRYVEIEAEAPENREKPEWRKSLCKACQEIAGDKWKKCCFVDVSPDTGTNGVGILLSLEMVKEHGKTEQEYLRDMLRELKETYGLQAAVYVGCEAREMEELAKSRRTAVMVKSLSVFREPQKILWYEREQEKYQPEEAVLCKDVLDALIHAVEANETETIAQKVAELYRRMGNMGMNSQMIDMNLHYLLFGLVHLAVQQDDKVSQEEVFSMIRNNAFDLHTMRGSRSHLEQFVREYAEYLVQLRRKGSRGVLAEVEREVSRRYPENLTLKEMSRKFYVNSAYLGQIFKKKHGISFKEYLNNYRVEQAAELLLRTDKKIYEIAEEVGYHDLDYFINRFIAVKGCTPSKFRKKSREKDI